MDQGLILGSTEIFFLRGHIQIDSWIHPASYQIEVGVKAARK
jgi:hypothetical protein